MYGVQNANTWNIDTKVFLRFVLPQVSFHNSVEMFKLSHQFSKLWKAQMFVANIKINC